jgi:hypothetical protein
MCGPVVMATEAIESARARDEAVTELRNAILSLQTGELRDAWNHLGHAQCWMREIESATV